jgi:hypothetical protein
MRRCEARADVTPISAIVASTPMMAITTTICRSVKPPSRRRREIALNCS